MKQGEIKMKQISFLIIVIAISTQTFAEKNIQCNLGFIRANVERTQVYQNQLLTLKKSSDGYYRASYLDADSGLKLRITSQVTPYLMFAPAGVWITKGIAEDLDVLATTQFFLLNGIPGTRGLSYLVTPITLTKDALKHLKSYGFKDEDLLSEDPKSLDRFYNAVISATVNGTLQKGEILGASLLSCILEK